MNLASDAFGGLNDTLNQLSRTMQSLSESIMGVVRAGLAGTAEGNRLAWAWVQLSRQIASIAKPVIDALTTTIQRMASAFGALSGDGQRVALIFGSLAIAAPLMARAFGLLSRAFQPIAFAVGALIEGMVRFFTKTAEGKAMLSLLTEVLDMLSPILGYVQKAFEAIVDAVVVGFQLIVRGAILAASKLAELGAALADLVPGAGGKVMANALKVVANIYRKELDRLMAQGWGVKPGQKKEDRNDVTPIAGTFEDIGAAFERVTIAANRFSDPAEKRHNDLMAKQGEIVAGLDGVREAVIKNRPAIGRG